MNVSVDGGSAGRARVAARIAKLEAMTVDRGASPSEAEFAARRARCLKLEFGLYDQNAALATIRFSPYPPAAWSAQVDGTIAPPDPPTAAAAYGTQPEGDRRRRSALRFVEMA